MYRQEIIPVPSVQPLGKVQGLSPSLRSSEAVLNFLLGHGKVPFEVYESVIEKLDIVDEHGELWQNIAKTLGETGNWKYVNRIPTIMIMLGYGTCFETCKVVY